MDDQPESNGKSLILLLLSNGVFYSMDADVEAPAESVFAFGTYTYNASIGELAVTDEYTSEGEMGITQTIAIASIGDQMKGDGLLLDRIFLGGLDEGVDNNNGNAENEGCREAVKNFEAGVSIDETFDSLIRYSCFWYSTNVVQGQTYNLFIEDEWTGLENGSDTVVELYEGAGLPLSGSPIVIDNNENKLENPISYQASGNEKLFIKFVNDGGVNPEELADVVFRLEQSSK